jgi:hypothetical protein
MSTSKLPTQDQPEPSTSQSPATSDKAKKLNAAVEKGIAIAKLAKGGADMNPLLGPLKPSMEGLIAVLESVRVSISNCDRVTIR